MRGVLAIAAVVCGCEAESAARLSVDVISDLAPGAEFDRFTLSVSSPDAPSESRVVTMDATDQDFTRGARIEMLDLATGSWRARVALERTDGLELVAQEVLVNLEGDRGITVVLSRDCRGITCADGGTRSEICLAGRCVDAECSPENPGACDGECTTAADCPAVVDCADAACIAGACLALPQPLRCGPGEFCAPDVGCRAVPTPGMPPGMPIDPPISSVDRAIRWTPARSESDTFTVGANEYEPQSAFQPWSINRATNATGDLTRFEVRQGDYWLMYGMENERAELDGYRHAFAAADERWMAFSLLIEPGDPPAAEWCALARVLASDAFPFSAHLVGERLRVEVESQAAPLYDEPIARGAWHHFVFRFRNTPGVLQVWLDGTQIVDFAGQISAPSSDFLYWKFGIFRGPADIPQTLVTVYANMELGAADLSTRIAAPQAIPMAM